jgi:hypothetical protein
LQARTCGGGWGLAEEELRSDREVEKGPVHPRELFGAVADIFQRLPAAFSKEKGTGRFELRP